ncbi:hypothetical protein ACJ41O_009532 [Fusarium nematophilum]
MSPDTVSSLFPDRPIRPLPKRRLREKLSPEVADSIKYPPSTHETAPLFYYPPYTVKDEGSPPRNGSASPVEQGRRAEPGRNYTPRRSGVGVSDGDEEDGALRSTLVTRSPPEILTRAARRPSRPDQARQPNPQPPPSTTSSVDGYDSFENTNNKKKRKIPSAGDPSLNGAHALNNEISSLAISGAAHPPASDLHSDRSYTHSRDFRARTRKTRAHEEWQKPAACIVRWQQYVGWKRVQSCAATMGVRSGIISNAIANAEKLRPQGQENVSLFQQPSSTTKTTPASTQFTFTCDSQVPGTVQWPGHSSKHNMATQTPSGVSPGGNAGNGVHHDGSSKAASGESGNSRRRSRRRLEKELIVAARNRHQIAADNYYQNLPRSEDIWICEFCEYERIFGEPPRALIRDYEIKDRRHRQEEADRKRLLEKAKAKSRKGRKNGKAQTRGHGTNQNSAQSQPEPVGEGTPPMDAGLGHSTQSEEEDYADEFEDEYSNSVADVAHRRDPDVPPPPVQA